MISQGTVSVLIGCHSVMHSYLVAKAWRSLYGAWPKPWELGCIALHDVGHIGKNYLDDPKQKAEHWRAGAELAGVLFGWKGFNLCAGHCSDSGFKQSKMYRADKTAWSIAPIWWLVWQQIAEPKLTPAGKGKIEHARDFLAWTAANVASSEPRDTHEGYLELKRGGEV